MSRLKNTDVQQRRIRLKRGPAYVRVRLSHHAIRYHLWPHIPILNHYALLQCCLYRGPRRLRIGRGHIPCLIMAPSHHDLLPAQGTLRPRQPLARPRSRSMYDTAPSSSHHRRFDGWIPRIIHPKPKLHLESSFVDPYLLPSTSRRSSSVSSDRKAKSNPSQSARRSSRGRSSILASSSSIRSTRRAVSQGGPRQIRPNPAIQRLLEKPSLLRTSPRRHAFSSTEPPSSHSDRPSTGSSTSSDSLAQEKGRTSFYQALVSKSVPLPPPRPGESRRPIPPHLFETRPPVHTMKVEEDIPKTADTNMDIVPLATTAHDTYNLSSDRSSFNLSIPAFYSNPKASSSEESVYSKTSDEFSRALRGLGPTSTPTIEQLPPSLSLLPNHSQRRVSKELPSRPTDVKLTERTLSIKSHSPKEPSINGRKTERGTEAVVLDGKIQSNEWTNRSGPLDDESGTRQPVKDPTTTINARRSSKRLSRISNGPRRTNLHDSTKPATRNDDVYDSNSRSQPSTSRPRRRVQAALTSTSNERPMTTVYEEKRSDSNENRSASPNRTPSVRATHKPALESPSLSLEHREDAPDLANEPNEPSTLAPRIRLPSIRRRDKAPPPLILQNSTPSPTTHLQPPEYSSTLQRPRSSAMSTISNASTIAHIVGPRPPSERELRRRRFLKLTKTLGEDIPPELLVTNCKGRQVRDSIIISSQDKSENKRKNSVGFPTVDPLMGALLLTTPEEIMSDPELRYQVTGIPPPRPFAFSFGTGPRPRDTNPRVLKKTNSLRKKVLSAIGSLDLRQIDDPILKDPTPAPVAPVAPVAPITIKLDTAPPPVPYFEDHPFRVVVEDTDHRTPSPSVILPRHTKDDARISRDEVPWMRASFSLPLADETPFLNHAVTLRQSSNHISTNVKISELLESNGVYRRENKQGWSGEWNQPHIQDVIEKLRVL